MTRKRKIVGLAAWVFFFLLLHFAPGSLDASPLTHAMASAMAAFMCLTVGRH